MAYVLHQTARLEPRGPAGAFVLSDEQVAALGEGRKAFAVLVTLKGQTFPLRVARMGGEYLIGLRRDVREAAGVQLGDTVEIEVVADLGERSVDLPPDLAAALDADPSVRARFDALAYSHRKEFVRWVSEAKREQTRASRAATCVEMVRQGRTR